MPGRDQGVQLLAQEPAAAQRAGDRLGQAGQRHVDLAIAHRLDELVVAVLGEAQP